MGEVSELDRVGVTGVGAVIRRVPGLPGLRRDAALGESALDGPLSSVKLFGDLGCGPAVLVEVDGLVDLVGVRLVPRRGI
jgi:hypothetical protein